MRLHHLNCISSCPLGGRLMDGRSGSILERGRLCCHCLLVELPDGLALVDTGFGLNDVRRPRERLSKFFLSLLSPDFREDMTAVRQVERLGYRAEDVRHIVLTHLDFDHAGGLDDFPQARVHLLRQERDDAEAQRSWLDRQRYRPQQWSSRSRWEVYAPGRGEPWFGFDGVRTLEGLPPDILLVPLPGHTMGHAGVAAPGRRVAAAGGRRLLLARGDGRRAPALHARPAAVPDPDGEGPHPAPAEPGPATRAAPRARGASAHPVLARPGGVRTGGASPCHRAGSEGRLTRDDRLAETTQARRGTKAKRTR